MYSVLSAMFQFLLTLYGMTRPHGRVEVFPVKVNFCACYNWKSLSNWKSEFIRRCKLDLNIQEAIYANKNMSFYLWSECYGGTNDVG